MKRKLFTLLLTLSMIAGILAGCGSEKENPAADNSPADEETATAEESTADEEVTAGEEAAAQKDAVTVSFMIWDGSHKDGMESIIASFEEDNPDIKVDLQITPWDDYWTKLEAAVGGTAGPDMFWINAVNVKKYQQAGLLANLSEVADLPTGDLMQNMLDIYTIEGGLYALPIFWDTTIVFVNTQLLEEYGIEAPKQDWTWDEMLAWSEAASQKLPDDIYPFITPMLEGTQLGLYTVIPSAGGQIYSDDGTSCVVNSEQALDGLAKVVEYANRDYCPTYEERSENSYIQQFMQEKAVAIGGISAGISNFIDPELSNLAGNVSVIAFPAINPQSPYSPSVIHGLGPAVNAKNGNQEACARFLEYMCTEEAMNTYITKNGTCTTRTASAETYVDQMKEKFNVDMSAVFTVAEKAMPYPSVLNEGKIESIFHDYTIKAYTGELSVEEAADKMVEEADALLE